MCHHYFHNHWKFWGQTLINTIFLVLFHEYWGGRFLPFFVVRTIIQVKCLAPPRQQMAAGTNAPRAEKWLADKQLFGCQTAITRLLRWYCIGSFEAHCRTSGTTERPSPEAGDQACSELWQAGVRGPGLKTLWTFHDRHHYRAHHISSMWVNYPVKYKYWPVK